MNTFIFCCVALCALQHIASSPLPTLVGKDGENQEKLDNKTIAELVQQQTNAIKQIVSNKNQEIRREYPVLTKYDSQGAQASKNEEEDISQEDFKSKCQHYLEIFNLTRRSDDLQSEPRSGSSTLRPFNPQIRPIYLQDRNRGTVKPPTTHTPQTTTKPTSSFYITQSTTKKPATQAQTLPQNIKLIKLEPVILQKTILNDGRIIYYWHKSLPSTVQYPSAQHNYYQQNVENPEAYKPSTHYPSSNTNYNTFSTTTSTTTTTPSNSGLSFRNYFPFYWSSGSNEESTSESTTKAPTVSSTTTFKPVAETNEDLMYAHQLRFVVPVPYEDPNNATKYLWDYNQHAYYPKPLQPTSVNVQVPYVPTFHMIKALTIPNKYISGENTNAYNNYYQKTK